MKKIIIYVICSVLFASCAQKPEEVKKITRELGQSITSDQGTETSVYKIDTSKQIVNLLDDEKRPNLGNFVIVRIAEKNTTTKPIQTSHYRDAQLLLGGKIYNPVGYLHIKENEFPGFRDCAVLCDINPGDTALESLYFDVPEGIPEAVLLAEGAVEIKVK